MKITQQHLVITALAFLVIFLMGKPVQVIAQIKLTDIRASGTYFPESRFIRPNETDKSTAKTSMSRAELGLRFDLSNKVDTLKGSYSKWTATLSGSYTDLQNTNYEQQVFPSRLVTADFGIQHLHSLNRSWSILYALSAGVYSDMEKVNEKDVFLNGGVAFIKRYNPNFTFGFGAFLNNAYGTPMVWPVLIVQWKTGDKFKLDVSLPDGDGGSGFVNKISYAYQVNKKTDLALVFKPRLMSYDTETLGDKRRMLSSWELPAGLENRWHFKHLDFVVGGGMVILRTYQFGEKKLSKMFDQGPTSKLASNYYLNMGIHWHF